MIETRARDRLAEDAADERSPDAVEFFHRSAEDYAGKHYRDTARSFMTVRQERVLEFVDASALPAGADVLDAGCGPGYLVEALAARDFRVSAMDAAEGMLREARRRLAASPGRHPVQFARGDIQNLPFDDESFDLVCSTGVIEYLPDDHTVLREFKRVLRPGGRLVLPVTNARSPVLWLDSAVEALKRRPSVLRTFNGVWRRLGRQPVLPRHFVVRRHDPSQFREALARAGFTVDATVYFHFLPWPRPFDQFLPAASAAVGGWMERWGRSRLGPLAEGYLALSTKPGSPGEVRPLANAQGTSG